ncbi:hypothetical protein OOT46_08885 [Aquabacterium sp. A7-Y]|uniref:hypothetical protein n=1 Tax=Aquabacterium sp. A7-Y TaxID=1349605 RepID=UPI00223CA670|nr:hypothetical protein [Aquabacterium sp. A7-Y]MCW7537964.1 hypothetical protein [Aquabacterium sp. A7-Y]
MKDLVAGVPASRLFRELMREDRSIDARELGDILADEFPDISPAASVAIWKWMNPSRGYEFPDEQIDALISHYLKEAGYTT